jgi:hypothetical protein
MIAYISNKTSIFPLFFGYIYIRLRFFGSLVEGLVSGEENPTGQQSGME